MPNAFARITGASPDGSTVNILVDLIPGPEGLDSFQIFDTTSAPITEVQRTGCRRERFVYSIPEPVPVFRLPIIIEARDCGQENGPPLVLGPFIQRGQPLPGGGMWCPPPDSVMGAYIPVSDQCGMARAHLSDARNDFLAACSARNTARWDRDSRRTFAVGIWAIVAAMAIVATIISAAVPYGWFAGILLYVFAAAFTGSAIASSVRLANQQAILDRAQTRLNEAAENFNAASRNVMARCCPSDYTAEQLTLPMC